MDLFDRMMAWEDGSITRQEEVELFQELVNNGMAWTLQGMYGRRAVALIASRKVKARKVR